MLSKGMNPTMGRGERAENLTPFMLSKGVLPSHLTPPSGPGSELLGWCPWKKTKLAVGSLPHTEAQASLANEGVNISGAP